MAITKQVGTLALVALLLASITACVTVMSGDPPAFVLMKADGVNYEGNPRLGMKYDVTLSKIYEKTIVNGLDPDEETAVTKIILKTQGALRKDGIKLKALEISQALVDAMPNDTKTYDLDKVAKSYLKTFKSKTSSGR